MFVPLRKRKSLCSYSSQGVTSIASILFPSTSNSLRSELTCELRLGFLSMISLCLQSDATQPQYQYLLREATETIAVMKRSDTDSILIFQRPSQNTHLISLRRRRLTRRRMATMMWPRLRWGRWKMTLLPLSPRSVTMTMMTMRMTTTITKFPTHQSNRSPRKN